MLDKKSSCGTEIMGSAFDGASKYETTLVLFGGVIDEK